MSNPLSDDALQRNIREYREMFKITDDDLPPNAKAYIERLEADLIHRIQREGFWATHYVALETSILEGKPAWRILLRLVRTAFSLRTISRR